MRLVKYKNIKGVPIIPNINRRGFGNVSYGAGIDSKAFFVAIGFLGSLI